VVNQVVVLALGKQIPPEPESTTDIMIFS